MRKFFGYFVTVTPTALLAAAVAYLVVMVVCYTPAAKPLATEPGRTLVQVYEYDLAAEVHNGDVLSGYVYVACKQKKIDVTACGKDFHHMSTPERPNVYVDLGGQVQALEAPRLSKKSGNYIYRMEVPGAYRNFAAKRDADEFRALITGTMPQVVQKVVDPHVGETHAVKVKINGGSDDKGVLVLVRILAYPRPLT